MRWLSLCLALAACDLPQQRGPTHAGNEGRPELDPAWLACIEDADCELVDPDCCAPCNARSRPLVVNHEHAAEARASHARACPAGCRSCGPERRAVCDDHLCSYEVWW